MQIFPLSNTNSNKQSNSLRPNFGLIELKKKDFSLAQQLMKEIVASENLRQKNFFITDLYKLFEPYLNKEGELKAKKSYILEEVISELTLKFMEFINSVNKKATLEGLIQAIDDYQPNKDIKKYQDEASLDAPRGKAERPLSEYMTEGDLPVPTSTVVLEKAKTQLMDTINSANLSPTMKKRIIKYGRGAKFSQIAKSGNVHYTTAERSVKKGILRIRINKGTLTEEDKNWVDTVSNMLGITFEKGLKLLSKNYGLKYIPFERMNANINDLMKILGTTREKVVKLALLQPQILYQSTEGFKNNIETSAKLLGVTKSKFIEAVLKQPQLMVNLPESVNDKAEKSAELLGVTKEEFVKAVIKQPPVLCMLPETLDSNINDMVSVFGTDRKTFISKILKYPQIMGFSIKKTDKRVQTSADLLKVDKQSFIKAALKHPSLFYQSPKTLNKRVNTSVKLLKVSREDFIKAGLLMPTLFLEKSKTLNDNAKMTAKLLGIKKEEFVKVALKQPQLLYQSPETINKNIEDGAKAVNLSKEEYLQYALKYPMAFCLSSETISIRFNLLSYYKCLKGKTSDVKIAYCVNTSTIWALNNIFTYLMQSNGYSAYSQAETIKKLPEILKPFKDSSCEIVLPKDETNEAVIKYMKECSEKAVGKNVFEFKIAA